MADAVTSQTLHDSDRVAVMKFTNLSDGSGESTVTKVDVSALAVRLSRPQGATPTRVAIEKIEYSVQGMTVDLLWDANTNVPAISLGGEGKFDFRSIGPLTNNASTGINGDLLFTTTDATDGDRYTIILTLRKVF